jgi:predicted dithiol-disulfide oxidoreductase (DUF899 family)
MGWKFPWVSSNETDFNYDYQASFTPEQLANGKVEYNFDLVQFPSAEAPGVSVFYKDKDGNIFHTERAYWLPGSNVFKFKNNVDTTWWKSSPNQTSMYEKATAGLDAFMSADREFHLSSYAGAASSEMWQIIHRMWNTTQHYRREFTRLAAEDGLSATHLEHRLLLDCIRRQDPDDAERVLVMHIRRTRLELEKHPEIFA